MIIKHILTISAFMLLATFSYSQMYDVSSTAEGGNEVPPNASAGMADVTGTYDAATAMITFTVNYTGLSSGLQAAHLHSGVAGVNGPVIINLTPPMGAMMGTFGGTFAVNPADEAALLAEGVYINLHTVDIPSGELRGQLVLTLQAAPMDTSIPTMGQWGLMALGLMFMIFGVVSLRQRQVTMA